MLKTNHKHMYLLFVWIIAVGCMCVPGGLPKIVPTPTPGEQPQMNQPANGTSPSEAETQSSLPVEEESPAAETQTNLSGLNKQGPWLLITTNTALWVSNPDGSALQLLISNAVGWRRMNESIRPNGNRIAVITSSGDGIHGLALNLISLPDINIQKITDLTTPETEPAEDSGPGDESFEAVRAMTDWNSLTWSPDGKKLAFIGAMDGPNAELYIYNTDVEEIKRVSKDNSQDFNPVWSPDGKYLLFFGTRSFGTGAGMDVTAVWSAKGNGSGVTMLYEPKDSSGEEFIGWVDHETAILDTWNAICGSSMLRLYNIVNTKKTIIEKDCIQQAAASPNGTLLYGAANKLYKLEAGKKKPEKIADGEVTQLEWKPESQIFMVHFMDGTLSTFDAKGGNQQDAPENGMLNVAQRDKVWGWSSYNESMKGIWVSGNKTITGQVSKKPADLPLFDQDNNLLFISGSQLYRSTGPLYEMANPVTDIDGDVVSMTWIGQ